MSQLPPNLQRFQDQARVIDSQRPCANCGYDLVGLRTGDRCPECATPIGASLFANDSLATAPLSFLGPFSRGCMLFAASAPFLLGFFGATVWRLVDGLSIRIPGAGAFLAAIGWTIGMFLATIPFTASRSGRAAPTGTPDDWNILRLIVRCSQACWPACVLALLAVSALLPAGGGTPAAKSFMLIAALTFLAGAIGLCAVQIYFIRIAIWAGDDELADRLKLFPLLVPVSCVIIVAAIIIVPILTGGPITFLLMPAGGVFALFLLFACWTFIRVCWSLGSLGYWATENRQTQLTSSQRRSARIVARIEGNMNRRANREPAGASAPTGPSTPPPSAQHLPPPGDGPIDLL